MLAKYDVIEEIGHGGMATVYRAMDKRLQREVAVKVIHPHLRESTADWYGRHARELAVDTSLDAVASSYTANARA